MWSFREVQAVRNCTGQRPGVKRVEKRAEQVLPGSKEVRGKGEWVGGRGEKWPKECMHI
jgi:hypothetical protein